jgi:hypothetical protein
VAADIARFWISRLHGSQANDFEVLRCLDVAARKLNESDEAGAQKALDASRVTRLTPDGVTLMRAVAGSLGIPPLSLPWTEGPRLWRAEDIAGHLPLFKDHAPAIRLLARWKGTPLSALQDRCCLPSLMIYSKSKEHSCPRCACSFR